MELIPHAQMKPLDEVTQGSVYLADIEGLACYCLRTSVNRGFPDPGAIVLGPFTDAGFGTPWVAFTNIGHVLDFGEGWVCQLPTDADENSVSGVGDPPSTGAMILNALGCYLQAVSPDGKTVFYYNTATCITAEPKPNRSSVLLKKWTLALRPDGDANPTQLITVTARAPRLR